MLNDNDQLIYEAVMEAVQDVSLVRESKAPVVVEVEDGVVTVTANVMSAQMKRLLLTAIAATPDVVKVIDKVYEDRNIEIQAARILGNSDAFRDLRPAIVVNCYKGILSLSGHVPDEAMIGEAVALVEGIRGVRRVRSELNIGQGAI